MASRPNGLNQYTAVGGATYVSDARGNLTSDAARTYGYDLDNHLTGVSGAQALTLSYDPLGRLRTVTTGGVTTTWLWDGDRLVAEYDNTGALSARYAHGPGPDEPLVDWFKTTSAGRLWFHTDHQNTVVALTDGTGAISGSPLTYDAYGQPAGGTYTGPRFRYTGQTSLPGAPPLWHYKARPYAPGIGRFLQTDPIGYEDSLNLYQYVGNDPLNGTDPTGMCWFGRCPPFVRDFANAVVREITEDPVGVAADVFMVAIDIATVPSGEGVAGVVARRTAREVAEQAGRREAREEITDVTISSSRHPEAAAHAADAQAAGQPSVLAIERQGAASRGREARAGHDTVPGRDRDEYPPAMTAEGGAGASIRPIDRSDNRGAGACLMQQCRNLPDGSLIRIVIGD